MQNRRSRLAECRETFIVVCKSMRAISVIFTVSLLLKESAFCGGAVEGTVELDAMRPQPVSPGYKPQTVKPIQDIEPPVAIVYLEGPGAAGATRKAQNVRIRQNGYQFRPSILAVQTGTIIEFPNEDDEFHNVFSYSKTKRFDLGRYRKDEPAKQAVFDKAGPREDLLRDPPAHALPRARGGHAAVRDDGRFRPVQDQGRARR